MLNASMEPLKKKDKIIGNIKHAVQQNAIPCSKI